MVWSGGGEDEMNIPVTSMKGPINWHCFFIVGLLLGHVLDLQWTSRDISLFFLFSCRYINKRGRNFLLGYSK